MLRQDHRRLWEAAKWSLTGVAATATLTLAAVRLHLNFTTASFCYLLLIVLLSLSGDLLSTVLTSFAAVGYLAYFFVEPLFSFRIKDPINVLALASFLITGLVIARLVTAVRAKAASSQLHHHKMKELYELAQKLLALEPESTPANEFLYLFVGTLGIQGACFFDAVTGTLQFAGNANALLEEKTAEAFARAKDLSDPAMRIHARCIRVGGRAVGSIGFAGLEDPQITAAPLGALGAAHMERNRSFREASRAGAAAHSEGYRSAILDALAHEFKTPLSTILAAAGALRDAGALSSHHREIAETIESEAARLSRLTHRLLRTARLEQSEVRPWMELTDLSSVLSRTVDQYSKLSPERMISLVKAAHSTDVMADPELIQLAVSQLLDNACKYSTPGSPVTLRVSSQREHISLLVQSTGNAIQPAEKQKIFDRFSRGVAGHRMAPGSGLGLFVARKIALAHGGSLELDVENGTVDGTTFRMRLPVPEHERTPGRDEHPTTV